MGNHTLEQCRFQVNTISPIVLEAIVVETRRQHVGVGVTQSLNASITTIQVEMVVAPSIDVFRMGVLIGYATKLGSISDGVLVGRNMSQSLALPSTTTRVVSIPQMVFINSITTTHGNRTIDRPLMNSMDVGGCKSVDAMHSRGGFQ